MNLTFKWTVTTNVLGDGTYIYQVYRNRFKGEPDHSGNREFKGGVFSDKGEAQQYITLVNRNCFIYWAYDEVPVTVNGKNYVKRVNNITDAFEIAMGRRLATANGVAEIKQRKTPKFALYFETCGTDGAGSYPIAKTWVYGCTSATRPTEEYNQTEDDINESSFEYSFDVAGTNVLTSDGSSNYTDDYGNDVIAWQQTAEPDDSNYSTFGDAVVLPQVAA